MLLRPCVGLLIASVGWCACKPYVFGAEPAVAGDEPSVNKATTQRLENMPYCSGGDRDRACVLGTNCRVTERGCQVCQCQALQ